MTKPIQIPLGHVPGKGYVPYVHPAEVERLRDLAELAVIACTPLLPLRGSAGNYEVERKIHPTLRALPEEWAEAAYHIADLDRAISDAFPKERRDD